jgi:hypothetical protein
MAKKATLLSASALTAPNEFDIPSAFGGGGKGRASDGRDRVSIIVDRGTPYLAVYLRDELLAHVADWRFAIDAFRSNGSGVIDALHLTKADRGYILRKGAGSRPHYHISTAKLVVSPVSVGTDEDVGTVVGTIESDGSITLTLPKAIKGKFSWFKLTRS